MSRNSLFSSLPGTLLRASLVPCVFLSVSAQAAEADKALALPATDITGIAEQNPQPGLTLGLQLNNLFDRQYATTTSNNGRQWYLGEPRSFFVTADYSF